MDDVLCTDVDFGTGTDVYLRLPKLVSQGFSYPFRVF